MERIVIEVDDATARIWKHVSPSRKKEIRKQLSTTIMNETEKSGKEDFKLYIKNLQGEMKKRGLTEEKLNEILKD